MSFATGSKTWQIGHSEMWLIEYFLVPLVLGGFTFGHLATWVMVINRLHATGLPRPLIKALDKVIYLAVVAIPALLVYLAATRPWELNRLDSAWQRLLLGYCLSCLVCATIVALMWICRRLISRRFAPLVSNDTVVHHVAADLGHRPVHGWRVQTAAAVPGNQLLELHVNVKTLRMPNLPPGLDGLSIAHLSDIHMTGRITQPFFDYVVDRANELDADLVCITGDIVEKIPCLAWIEPTLGRLRARHGKFFVLGNHDKRLRDVAGVRQTLANAGLVDLGGRWTLHNMRGGEQVLLAGNELPWFGPAPDLSTAPPRGTSCQLAGARGASCQLAGTTETPGPFRILLSHTPDQIHWARFHDFDLMLAGHNHGGQICLPLIGPLVSPSLYGVKYASGLFLESPTLLHVSRGVSGLEPFRFNCPPELTKLVLAAPNTEKG